MSDLIERLRWYAGSNRAKTEHEAADEIERLTAVVEPAKAAYEAYEDDELTHDHYQDIGNALAALEAEQEGYCYCKIGAGGPPCVSREVCDSRGGTKQYTDKERES